MNWKPGDRFTASGQHGTIISRPRKSNKRLGDWLVAFDGEQYTRHVQEWYMHPVDEGSPNRHQDHLDWPYETMGFNTLEGSWRRDDT